MATAVEQIGLFPLEVVLFPGAYLPLHIYEPRYHQLVRECLAANQPFGINLLSERELHRIGCTASIHAIVQQYHDGRLTIVVVGKRRYILHSLDDIAKPYAVGTIEYIDDIPGEQIEESLYGQCVRLYNQLINRVFPDARQFTLPEDIVPRIEESTPSFFMAQKAGLKLVQKQTVLSLRSENERLKFLLEHLQELLPRLDKFEEIMRIVRTDGYFAPGFQIE